MPEIFDNQNQRLGQALQDVLASSKRLDACTGYFNLLGWQELATAVGNLPFTGSSPTVRLLIGMMPLEKTTVRNSLWQEDFQRHTNKEAEALRQEAKEYIFEQLSLRLPTTFNEATLRTLRAQILEGRVQVKLHLAYRLHAKLYLCHLQDETVTHCKGFLGSSNLTHAGLQFQGELNIDVLDGDANRKLQDWFEDRWADPLSVKVDDFVVSALDQSWPSEKPLSPYLIHLKLAYHLSRDAREGLNEFEVPKSIRSQLLDFQAAAVKITARRIMVQGGAMIADVVGLGKTIMAIGVALALEERYGFDTLIIAPRNLVDMWQSYLHEYRLSGRVLSRTVVHRDLSDMRRFRLMIIDESHHLRTRTRRDYINIRDYISQNEPKVLLLTATPFNRSMEDVANQLGLFLSDDAPLPVRPEAALRQKGESAFKQKFQLDRLNSLDAMRRSDEIEDWQHLLSHYLIRRTRSFIEENYAERDADGRSFLSLRRDETRFYLPQRLPQKLEWKTGENDPTAELESEEVLDEIQALSLPRYQLQNYLQPGATPTKQEADILARFTTGSQGNLIGITRAMLYKRLSSSGYSLLASLRRHLLHNYVMLEGLATNDVIPVGAYDDSRFTEDGSDEGVEDVWTTDLNSLDPALPAPNWSQRAGTILQQLKERLPAGLTLLNANLFNVELQRKLKEDNHILQGVLDRVPIWEPERDSKTQALAHLLCHDHGRDKVLVFTEFAHTAEYLYQTLQIMGLTDGLGLITGSHVATVKGDTTDAVTLAHRFSPRTSGALSKPKQVAEEIRVLIATDVLSEGLNLQDCSTIVNFDLPWAIIKLIQRAGRVDRIGQEAEQVSIYSICPTEGVEAVIDLRGRIRRRLATSARVFGSDERFFGDPEEEEQVRSFFNENAALAATEESEDEVDYISRAFEIWRQANELHPKLVARAQALPHQTHATQEQKVKAQGILACISSSLGVDRIFFKPAGEAIRIMSPLEALAHSACTPETHGLPHQKNHHEVVAEMWQIAERQGSGDSTGSLTGVRRRVYERLRPLFDRKEQTLFAPSADERDAIHALFRHPLQEHANQLLKRALRDRLQDEDLLGMVTELHGKENLVIQRVTVENEMQLICSMGFV